MRGKKPKDREFYVLRLSGGMLVEVTREVYLEWYQSRRREKYQEERKRKKQVCSYEELEREGGIAVIVEDSLEETVIRELCREKVREALETLSKEDAQLVQMLFFEDMPVNEVAKIYCCSRRTIQNRRLHLLDNLRMKLRKAGIQTAYI